MGFGEVSELFAERVPERIRLEYKSQVPQTDADFKDEMSKAISSFANTYGGYVVIGILTDAAGTPVAMDGVPQVPGYAQKITSIGYQDVYPPLMPTVSNPIQLDNGNVVYVVHQDLSLEAPHFRTKRRGAYVRTNEFSQRFTPRLATWDDLRFLANRRSESNRLRENFILQSRERGTKLIPSAVWRRHPPTLMVWIGPSFPVNLLVDLGSLQDTIDRSRVRAHSEMFPLGSPRSVKDAVGLVEPAIPQYAESNAYGVSFAIVPFGVDSDQIVYAAKVLADVLIWVRYGVGFLKACGYNGQIHGKATLFQADQRTVIWRERDSEDEKYVCHENEISVETTDMMDTATQNLGSFALSLFKPLIFGAGWIRVFQVPDTYLLAKALENLRVKSDFLRMA